MSFDDIRSFFRRNLERIASALAAAVAGVIVLAVIETVGCLAHERDAIERLAETTERCAIIKLQAELRNQRRRMDYLYVEIVHLEMKLEDQR